MAGIVGAICSMRLEVLVFQAQSGMSRAAILVPAAAIAVVTSIIYLGFGIAAYAGIGAQLSPYAAPMILGLGLSSVQNFAFVQVKKLNKLLVARAAQAAALGLLMIPLGAGWWSPTGLQILFLIGLAYVVPAAVSIIRFTRSLPVSTEPAKAAWPDWTMFKRSFSLTVSTGVNAVYVNLPLLAAAATQSVSFVGDFGLIMRACTAPTTLISQVIGRMFLADALRWSIQPQRKSSDLLRPMSRTILQCMVLYSLMTPVLIGALYLYREELSFSHFGIAPFLFLAGLGQCAINPIGQVRMALSDERAFLFFDMTRLTALGVGLYLLVAVIPYEMAFGMTSFTLYVLNVAFIFARLSRYTPR
jgi:hypothetical protein